MIDPCPFCGSTDVSIDRSRWVQCNGCNVMGPTGDDREHAIKLWNTRFASKKPTLTVIEEAVE